VNGIIYGDQLCSIPTTQRMNCVAVTWPPSIVRIGVGRGYLFIMDRVVYLKAPTWFIPGCLQPANNQIPTQRMVYGPVGCKTCHWWIHYTFWYFNTTAVVSKYRIVNGSLNILGLEHWTPYLLHSFTSTVWSKANGYYRCQ